MMKFFKYFLQFKKKKYDVIESDLSKYWENLGSGALNEIKNWKQSASYEQIFNLSKCKRNSDAVELVRSENSLDSDKISRAIARTAGREDGYTYLLSLPDKADKELKKRMLLKNKNTLTHS